MVIYKTKDIYNVIILKAYCLKNESIPEQKQFLNFHNIELKGNFSNLYTPWLWQKPS